MNKFIAFLLTLCVAIVIGSWKELWLAVDRAWVGLCYGIGAAAGASVIFGFVFKAVMGG